MQLETNKISKYLTSDEIINFEYKNIRQMATILSEDIENNISLMLGETKKE